MIKKLKFWESEKEPVVLSRNDVIFSLSKMSRAKSFLSQITKFLLGSNENIAFLKIESKEINYVMIPVELFDKYQEIARSVKRYEDDVYIMSEIVKRVNQEN